MTLESIISWFMLSITPHGICSTLLFSITIAAACGPMLVLLLAQLAQEYKKNFYEKCALQTMQTTLIFTLLSIIGTTAAAFALPQGPPEHFMLQLAQELALPILSLLLSALWLAVWSKTSEPSFTRFAVSQGAVLGGILLFLWITSKIHLLAFAEQGIRNAYFLQQFTSTDQIIATAQMHLVIFPALVFIGYAFFVGIAIIALGTAIWLFVRRNTADYGRDYYTFAIRFMAKTAMVSMPFSGIFAFLKMDKFVTQATESMLLYYGFIYAPILLVTILAAWVSLSKTPLRHKVTIFLIFLLSIFTPLMQLPGILQSLLMN